MKKSLYQETEESKQFRKSPAYAELMSVATIKKDINGKDIICIPDDFETGYKIK